MEVEGDWNGRELVDARLSRRSPAPTPTGDGEVARFILAGVGARLASRARALSLVRQYFAEQGFLEVTTPSRVRAPGLDAHVQALLAPPGWLSTSPEFHMKRLLVGGLPRVYQNRTVFSGGRER